MRRLTTYLIAALSLASISLHAANNITSYPASLCYQSTGPQNSLKINQTGDVSNADIDRNITLFCPVVIAQEQLSSLEVEVVLIDENASGKGVSCQLSGSSFTSQYASKWGNTVSSDKGLGLQTVVARLSELDTGHSRYAKANLSCTLPPASEDGKVALLSYRVASF
jgi:hypothetical protein